MQEPRSSLTSLDRRRDPLRDRAGGLALVLGAALAVVFMLHHPTGPHGGDGGTALEGIAAAAGMVRGVHVAILGALFVLAFGHAALASALGLARPAVRVGAVAYAAGFVALGLAGVLNGLVAPAFAAQVAGRDDAAAAHVVLLFGWELNQALAAVGIVMTSLAIAAWSAAMLRMHGAWRLVAALGLVVGLSGGGATVGGAVEMDVHGFGALVLAQAVWAAAAGLLLIRPMRA